MHARRMVVRPFDGRQARIHIHLSSEGDGANGAVPRGDVRTDAPHDVQSIANNDHLVVVAAVVQEDCIN
jgi:hypothetical protein